MNNKYVFVADIDGDIDDIIVIEWLYRKNFLNCVIMDGQSRNSKLEEYISNLSIKFNKDIPYGTKVMFCGGALTKIAEYLKNGNYLDSLIMNGGFAGSNIVPIEEQLPKFKNKKEVRTYNFNLDIEATEYVLSSKNVNSIYLISKNVCHSKKNTLEGIFNFGFDWITKNYKIHKDKRLHDLLMVIEGINLLTNTNNMLKYKKVIPYVIKSDGVNNNMAKWGSIPAKNSNIFISIGWKE